MFICEYVVLCSFIYYNLWLSTFIYVYLSIINSMPIISIIIIVIKLSNFYILCIICICRDSSCASFNIANTEKFGRITKFYIVRGLGHIRYSYLATIKLYPQIHDPNQTFKYYTILAYTARPTEIIIDITTDINYKCIFLQQSKFGRINGQSIILARRLLVHAFDKQQF